MGELLVADGVEIQAGTMQLEWPTKHTKDHENQTMRSDLLSHSVHRLKR
jgi:hypothetical protein